MQHPNNTLEPLWDFEEEECDIGNPDNSNNNETSEDGDDYGKGKDFKSELDGGEDGDDAGGNTSEFMEPNTELSSSRDDEHK